MNIIIKKWIEPYVLLETFKKNFEMKDFTFEGFSKNNVKADFLKALHKEAGTAFGLYMKNVNKFYLFKSSVRIDIQKELFKKELNFKPEDIEYTDDTDIPLNLVDIGKAEAGIITAD